MKKLFTLISMALMAMGANAASEDLSLDDLGSGWSSSYDAATKTITYESAWSGRGWWLDGKDCSAYKQAVVEFEQQELGVTLCVQYFADGTTSIDETLNSTAAVDAGVTKIAVPLSENKGHVAQIYIQCHNAGTVVLKSAYLTDAEGDPQPEEPTYEDGVLWEGTMLVNGWADQPYVLSDGGKELKAAGAEAGDYLYFYASAPDDTWQIQLVEGHWGPKYATYSAKPLTDENGNPVESTIVDLATQGYFSFQLTEEVLATAYTAGGWGGSFLFNGDGNITVTKVQLVKKSAEAKTVFSWVGGEEGATVTGGTVTGNGADAESVNMKNSSYYVIRVSSKKAAIDTDNVTITLDEALQADDEIAITAYRNKDTDANGTLYMLFENGTVIDEGDNVVWNNIHANVGQEPNTNTYKVGDAAGSKTIKLARSKSSTNVFITAISINRGGVADSIEQVKSVVLSNGAIYNLRGQRVDASYKGIVIRDGKKFLQK